MKNYEFPKFWSSPKIALFLAPFSRAVGQISKFSSQHFICLVVHSTQLLDTILCPKNLGGDRFGRIPHFWGPGLTLAKASVVVTRPKLLLKS